MKKFYIILISFFAFAFVSNATIVNVGVSDNTFTPENFTITQGDTIMWTWVNGNHTTTSTVIPVGAGPWDQIINQNTPMYMYVPNMPGEYHYQCTYHVSMGMVGQFTVESSAGIGENIYGVTLKIFANPVNQELNLYLKSSKNTEMTIALNDVTGRQVKLLASGNQISGEHNLKYNVADLPKGIYFVKVTLGNDELVRKIIL